MRQCADNTQQSQNKRSLWILENHLLKINKLHSLSTKNIQSIPLDNTTYRYPPYRTLIYHKTPTLRRYNFWINLKTVVDLGWTHGEDILSKFQLPSSNSVDCRLSESVINYSQTYLKNNARCYAMSINYLLNWYLVLVSSTWLHHLKPKPYCAFTSPNVLVQMRKRSQEARLILDCEPGGEHCPVMGSYSPNCWMCHLTGCHIKMDLVDWK